LGNIEFGVTLGQCPIKGISLVATRRFEVNEFVINYTGELLSKQEGENRFERYPNGVGSFLFFFNFNRTSYCVDATYSKGLGRFANHSRKNPNAKMKVIQLENLPRLYLVALRVIEPKKEILYDYGETDPSIEWLRNS